MEGIREETVGIFSKLKQATVWAHGRWLLFRQLFADEHGERIPLLNQTSPMMFNVILYAMLDDLTLFLCKVTDRPQMMGRQNMVVEQLVLAVAEDYTTAVGANVAPGPVDRLRDLRDRLRASIDSASQVVGPLREYRNKIIAHWDWDLAQGTNVAPLPDRSRDLVERSLRAVAAVLNVFEFENTGTQTIYYPSLSGRDGRALIRALREAEAYRGLVALGRAPEILLPARGETPI